MNATGIRIRLAQFDDIEAMRTIEVAAGALFRQVGMDAVADDDPPSAAELAGHITAGRAWLAADGDQPVGYAVARVVDGIAHLHQVSVRPEHAGRRIGQALVDQVCRWASEAGHDAVTLSTFRDVAWNAPYYRRLGFRDLGEDELGPGLRSERAAEEAHGLDVSQRLFMRKELRQ
jgi:ribosomal protein S18 acetylase RimI-like enzyme